jgi:trans-aconitate methyltransferase
VFSSFALQWPPNKNAVFQGAYKSLKKNGVLAMTIPLDISHALEAAVNMTSCLPQWHPYFQASLPSLNLTKRNEFKCLLEENSFLITQFTEVLQATTFYSRLALEK